MKRILVLLMASAILGCQGEPAPATPPATPSPAADGGAHAGEETLQTSLTEFYLYDARPLEGVAKKPLLTIKADQLSVGILEGKSVSFKNARATMRSADPSDPEIVFQAAEGVFVENEQAYLKGGVVAQVGDMTVDLEDIQMNSPTEDAPLVAESTHRVRIDGPGMHLEAGGVRLLPEEKSFEMTDGTGYIDFGRFKP